MKTQGQQLKILYIVTQGNLGGAQKYVSDLASEFSKTNQVWVASGYEGQGLEEKLTPSKIAYFRFSSLGRSVNPFRDIQAIFEIRSKIKQLQPDIVHLNSSKAGVIGSLAARLAGAKKIIFTAHGLVLNEPMNGLKETFYRIITKLSFLLTDKILLVSKTDYNLALQKKLAPPEKLVLVEVGLDYEKLSFFDRTRARTRLENLTGKNLGSNKIIGTVADFYPAKGLDILLDAAQEVLKSEQEIKFILFARKGPIQKQILRRIAADKNLRSGFFPVLDRNDASSYLKAFDLFVLPSVKEGFPYTLLEAVAAEIPIIASGVGGIPEILENSSAHKIITPADHLGLAKSMTAALENPSDQEQLRRHASHIKESFSLPTIVQKVWQIYKA